jgi:hypothetical protein
MTENTSQSAPRERAGFELVGPQAVVRSSDMSREQKIELLREWEQDLREEMVAEEENMPNPRPLASTLEEVLAALRALGAEPGTHAPTKHG